MMKLQARFYRLDYIGPKETFNAKVIAGGWRYAGLMPLRPLHVLERVPRFTRWVQEPINRAELQKIANPNPPFFNSARFDG